MDVEHLVRGAVGLAKAAAGIDRRDDEHALRAARRCAACIEHQTYGVADGVVGFCGGVTGGEYGRAGRVCHCLVTLTIAGHVRPMGKTLVEGESCPQGWF